MRKITRGIDRFCASHPRFGIPNMMLFIVIANAVVWLLTSMDRSGTLYQLLLFSPYHILHGQIWRLVTFIIIPDSNGIWIIITLYFSYFIGSTLERSWGTARFTLYYITGVLLTIIYGLIAYFAFHTNIAVSATYINLSMFFSFAALYPDQIVLLFFIIPIKIKWLAIVDAVFFVLSVFQLHFPVNLLPVVAVLNFVFFCWEDLMQYSRLHRRSQSKTATNFRRERDRINRETRNRSYTKKCAVCGRTDTDYPNLEFRYCSRCAGYHCFCQDHIFSHEHFTE